ncbi:hypothetical protein SAY87_008190 [Trapa incisa]|uniref:Uncharacterized protein n=1 Tax=Trapa incisa TaxID=236973 RepID=A0AAN7QGG6_9MYRT|nr:hypothetical protein SAY87_008190 [Trapa incisa]
MDSQAHPGNRGAIACVPAKLILRPVSVSSLLEQSDSLGITHSVGQVRQAQCRFAVLGLMDKLCDALKQCRKRLIACV